MNVYGAGGLLEIRDVQIAWKTPEHYLIGQGLEAGEQVILSRLGNAVTGMQLRRLPQGKLNQAQELRNLELPGKTTKPKNNEVQP